MKYIIAEDLKPNLENVSREFIIGTITEIMYDKYYPNFNFVFTEKEAVNYINDVINSNININLDEKCRRLIEDLKKVKCDNLNPCIVIKDYKLFFNLLVELYKKVIEYYFKDENNRKFGFPIYEMKNNFIYIWLRMLSEDFNNPELFLRKQIEMMNNETLSKYDNEIVLGNVKSLGDNLLSIKTTVSETWNENYNEFRFKIYDKKTYDPNKYFNSYYMLPIVRYGIYEKNGVKVCVIGSIQNKNLYDTECELDKLIERKKYKLNKNIDEEYIKGIEPKCLLSLAIFIDILIKEGIYDIEIPCLYALDNMYHKKWGKKLVYQFQERYKNNGTSRAYYEEDKKSLSLVYKKEDLISEIKSNKYIKLFERLMKQYNSFEITSYPFDVDSNLCIRLNKVNSIDNEMLDEINNLINDMDKDKIYKVC